MIYGVLPTGTCVGNYQHERSSIWCQKYKWPDGTFKSGRVIRIAIWEESARIQSRKQNTKILDSSAVIIMTSDGDNFFSMVICLSKSSLILPLDFRSRHQPKNNTRATFPFCFFVCSFLSCLPLFLFLFSFFGIFGCSHAVFSFFGISRIFRIFRYFSRVAWRCPCRGSAWNSTREW